MMALDASQNLEDAELLAHFAKGDRAVAQVLTARLAPVVYAQAFRMLGDRAEAEDITQDSLLRLWHAAPDWQAGQAKVTTWLYRVTSNLCIDNLRKSKRQSSDAVPEMPDDGPDMERRLQDRARAQALRAALSDLPDRQKQALVLRHL
jgi:RNA polymerase sigma-70 factor (ECF subfamily)